MAFQAKSQELWDRSWAVTIGLASEGAGEDDFKGIKITELDVNFKIEKSLKDEPNKCTLKVFNLTEDQRAAIEELNPPTKAISSVANKKVRLAARKQATQGIPVKIEAGYGGDNSLLWLGDIRTAHSVKEGPDWVTILESGDGEKAYQNARMNVSYGPMTPVDTALRAMVRALGIAEGNVESAIRTLKQKGKIYPKGTVLSGPVAPMITDFCRAADLEWSVQDGAIQILNRGEALKDSAFKVSPKTGLLGSPSVDVDGILKCKILMTPDVRPGRLIVVDAARVKGNYKIDKATWQGDSSGEAWEIDLEAERY